MKRQDLSEQIEILLRNFEILAGDAAELAEVWSEMDEEEQTHHRMISMQIWGMRYELGQLYRAGRLSSGEATQLAELDRRLLEHASSVEIAYGPTLPELVEDLVQWGTPLSETAGSIRLEIPLRLLPALAQVLVTA